MSVDQPHPDQSLNFGWLNSWPDDLFLPAALLNVVLRRTSSRKRARIILTEGDAIPAAGLWTPEEAKVVAQRLTIVNGEYTDPNQRAGLWAIAQYLGIIK